MPFARKLFEDNAKFGWRIHECTDVEETAQLLEMNKVKIHAMMIVNNGTGETDFVKLYNSPDVTVGTTDPDLILPSAASETYTILFKNGLEDIFTNALTIACVTAAGTAGTTAPTTSTVDVHLAVEDDV